MKKNLLLAIAFILLLILNSQAQVVSTNSSLIEIADNSNEKIAFTFTSVQTLEDELGEIDYYDAHFLGDEIARKAQVIKNLYVKQNEVTVGFGNSHVEIQKPIIYNSINKIESHLKKGVRKGKISSKEASSKFSKYLSHAYVLYFEADTENFEFELQKVKEADSLMEIFDSIEIKYL